MHDDRARLPEVNPQWPTEGVRLQNVGRNRQLNNLHQVYRSTIRQR